MSLQIGRIGLATANGGDGYTLDDPSTIVQNGRSLKLEGVQSGTTTGLLWLRDQFLGLVDPGAEPVIPVRFSTVSQLDGFYRIEGAQADHPRGGLGASGSTNWMFWSVDLYRISDWTHPRIEIFSLGAVLTNSHSITQGYAFFGITANTDSYGIGIGGATSSRSNGDGVNNTIYVTSLRSADWTNTEKEQISPTYWYQAACRVEHNVAGGGTYYSVVGRRSFPDATEVGRLRLSNGLVRVTWTTAASGVFGVSWWGGSAWEGPTSFTIEDINYSTLAIKAASVIRNTPEECAVRFVASTATGGPFYVDFSVRRGSRNLVGYGVSAFGINTLRLKFTSSTSSTSISGGLRRTSNNSDGNRELLVSNNGTTITTASGSIAQVASPGPFLFAVGCEVDGSSATGRDTADSQSGEFFFPIAETQTVVAL